MDAVAAETIGVEGVVDEGVHRRKLVILLEEDDLQPRLRTRRRVVLRERRSHQVEDGDGVLAAVEGGDDAVGAVETDGVGAHAHRLAQHHAELVIRLCALAHETVQRQPISAGVGEGVGGGVGRGDAWHGGTRAADDPSRTNCLRWSESTAGCEQDTQSELKHQVLEIVASVTLRKIFTPYLHPRRPLQP